MKRPEEKNIFEKENIGESRQASIQGVKQFKKSEEEKSKRREKEKKMSSEEREKKGKMEQEQGRRNQIYQKINRDQNDNSSIKQIKNIIFEKGKEGRNRKTKTGKGKKSGRKEK